MEKLSLMEEKGEWLRLTAAVVVNFVPLLYEKRRVAKQLQIETLLALFQLVKELGIEK